MSLTIAITGATGFLGSRLVKAFLHGGHNVIILKRSFSRTTRVDSIISECSVYDLDRCDFRQIFKDFNKVNVIIHTATCYGRNQESISEIFDSNVAFPLKLLEAGGTKIDTFFNTDTTLSESLNFYALSKKHFLDWGKQFSRYNKLKFVNLKLEHFFGEEDDPSKFVTHVIRSCLQNVKQLDLTMGEQERDFVHIDDVVSIYQFLLEKALSLPSNYQEYPVGSGKVIIVRELVELIHHLTASHTQLNFGAIPYRENEVMFSQANLKPLNELGFIPKSSLEDSLRKTINFEKSLNL